MTQAVQTGEVMAFAGLAQTRCAAGAVGQFPKEVRWMGIGVAGGCGAQAWVEADEDANQVGPKGISE